jgi:GTPase
VFTDTPGFHKPRTALGEHLNARVAESVIDVDVVMQVVDVAAGVGRGDAFVAESKVRPHRGPKVMAVNKIDRVRHRDLPPHLEAAGALAEFDHLVPVSARTGEGLDELCRVLVASLPEGEPFYPAGETTDTREAVRIAETIREKALDVTREEVPHSIAVTVEEVVRDPHTGFVTVSAFLYVERDSQKGILIGHGGLTLKDIGTRARQDLERLFDARVHLDLRVKVLREWQRDPTALRRLGL